MFGAVGKSLGGMPGALGAPSQVYALGGNMEGFPKEVKSQLSPGGEEGVKVREETLVEAAGG